MYKHNTFSELLKLLDRSIVRKSVKQHESDKYSKGFGTWNQLVAMIFSQLVGCRSLRDLEIRFNAKKQCHYQLRSHGIKKSTLSDANKKRNSNVFRDIAMQLISGQGKELKEVVSLIDSSIIRIDGRGSEWTEPTANVARQGFKASYSMRWK
jgi:putative transposase